MALSDGGNSFHILKVNKRKLVIRGVGRRTKGTVAVAAVGRYGTAGRSTTARIKHVKRKRSR